MRPVVYIDVLFLINFFINLLLLYTTAKLMKLKIHSVRLPLAAFLGAAYAVMIFFPKLSLMYTSSAKIFSSLAISAVAFNIKGVRLYIKTLITFLLVTICFGGGIFAIMCFTGLGAANGMVIKNGVLYMNLPWQFLVLSVIVLFIIITGVRKALAIHGSTDTYIDMTVTYSGHSTSLKALIDTGNALCDPISSAPVIVAEFAAVRAILPQELACIFDSGNENNLSFIEQAAVSTACRIRLIPYTSVGCENGMLIGFKPDKVQVSLNESLVTLGDVIIGLCSKGLSNDKTFHALIHPEIIS